MKKTGVLNSEIARVIALLGHTDMIVVCDSGYPIPKQVQRIDLALKKGVPGIVETVAEIERELEVERITFAEESDGYCSTLIQEVRGTFPRAQAERITHNEFKELANQSVAFIRTGECIPYSNVILHAGVAF
jgi:D-ribose pyranase